MQRTGEDIRKYDRYESRENIAFHYAYDFVTRMKVHGVEKEENKNPVEDYSAVSKNVSAEGLCFTSEKRLEKGEVLELEMFLLRSNEPVHLIGEVKWSQTNKSEGKTQFDTGLKVLTVEGREVHASVYYDESHHVIWSAVLESILGKFRLLANKIKAENG